MTPPIHNAVTNPDSVGTREPAGVCPARTEADSALPIENPIERITW